MSSRGEVITLQLGGFSNFVASHLWNLQSNCFYYEKQKAPYGLEFNHDTFYREGRTVQNKTTFSPRTVLIDLKGCVRNGPLPVETGYFGENDHDQHIWDGEIQVHKAEPHCSRSVSKSEELGEVCANPKYSIPVTRDSWAGYLQNKYHPKSVLISNRFDVDNPQQPFDQFNQGEELWNYEGESFEDRIRWFAEDSDFVSAFNIISDASNGYTGFTAKCLEYLCDDFRGKARLVWNIFDIPKNEKFAVYRSLNSILSYNSLFESADIVLPLATTTDGISRNLIKSSLQLDLSPHTSGAAMALFIDSIMSSLKLKVDTGCDTSTFSKILSEGNRKFAQCSMRTLVTSENVRLENFSPKMGHTRNSAATYAVSRGCQELVEKSLAKICHSNPSTTFHTPLKHPSKFSEEHFPYGLLTGVSTKAGMGCVNGLFAVQNSCDILAHFDDLLKRRFDLNKLHRCTVPKDVVEDALNTVSSIREVYLG